MKKLLVLLIITVLTVGSTFAQNKKLPRLSLKPLMEKPLISLKLKMMVNLSLLAFGLHGVNRVKSN